MLTFPIFKCCFSVNKFKHSSMTKYFEFLLFSFLLILSSCIKEEDSNKNSYALAEGDSLPEFSLTSEKETVHSAQLQKQIALIIFFNTTCSDCRQSFPAIYSLYKQYKNEKTVSVVLIAREQNDAEVKDYFTQQHYEMDFFTDPARKVYGLFASQTIPRLFLTKKGGKIVTVQAGAIDADAIKRKIEILLNRE